jgi:putative endonuclease
MPKPAYVYIMTNNTHSVLYTGMTADLARRVQEHKNALSGFTAKYNCRTLAYYECCPDVTGAAIREKQIKAGSRNKKMALIESINPEWQDLFNAIIG